MSCISKAFRTGIRVPPSCSARVIARGQGQKRTPQPAAGIRAAAQARGPAGGDRARVVADHRGGRAQADTAPRRGGHWPRGRRRDRPPQDGQALRRPHHRRRPLLAAQRRPLLAAQRRRHRGGGYVIRTSVPAAAMTGEQAVGAYKELARVDFRSLKTVDLEIPSLPLARPAGPGVCVAVYARLPRRMADARPPRADALRRCRQGGGRTPLATASSPKRSVQRQP